MQDLETASAIVLMKTENGGRHVPSSIFVQKSVTAASPLYEASPPPNAGQKASAASAINAAPKAAAAQNPSHYAFSR